MGKLICARSEDALPWLEDDSVDLIVTDPPYGLHFMGKDWDRAVPSVEIWRQALRVLKPGAFAFVMSGPRMDCLSEMGKRLAEAGFEIGFTPIFWAYASGFPKAANVGKLVDKRNARRAQEYQALGDYLAERRQAGGLSQKDIARHFPSKTGGLTGCVWNWENAANVPTPQQWSILKEALSLDNRFDELIDRAEAEREVIGRKQWDASVHHFVPGENHTERTQLDITAPATPEAQALDGSYAGFQPKPAVEVVIVAMKPLSHGTYVDQALDNGHGVTWLDDARIPTDGQVCGTSPSHKSGEGWDRPWRHDEEASQRTYEAKLEGNRKAQTMGRFPANLLCSDDCLNDGRVTTSPSGFRSKGGFYADSGTFHNDEKYRIEAYQTAGGDSGSFSRYFSLDAWAIANLPDSVQRTFPFLIVPKAPQSEKWFLCRVCDDVEHSSRKDAHADHNMHCHTCGVEFNREEQKAQHKGHKTETNLLMHPTQKPVKLFAYLITLGSRPGDLVADLFAGTCTTGMAAKTLGRDYLMVEQEEEWCQIGKRRTEAVEARLI